MPKVHFGVETYEVDDELYREFLQGLLIDDIPIEDLLCQYSSGEADAIDNYIKYRLLEVDPGYGPRALTDN